MTPAADVSIEATPTWLDWSDAADSSLVALRKHYYLRIEGLLGAWLARARQRSGGAAVEVERTLLSCEGSAFLNIVHAPSTAYLLEHRPTEHDVVSAHIKRSARAEMLRGAGLVASPSERLWSARGDFAIRGQDAARFHPNDLRLRIESRSLGRIPLDFRSPHALGISVDRNHAQLSDEALGDALPDIALYSPEDEELVVERLTNAIDLIGMVSSHVRGMIESFTLAIAVRSDPTTADAFSSGSSGQFTGRTTLINPLASGVDDLTLADALVHEAIHSLLYMQERLDPWVADPDVFFGRGYSTISPWSGRSLTPRQYMQACFVWYGLYRFWSLDGSRTAFGSRAAEFAEIAREGFYAGHLCERLESWKRASNSALVRAIESLQRRVIRGDYGS